ncbi:cytochrome c1 [uncultured Amphritea sp.]|jgi:ubiquinol-cytochrome c reductase cytochrome c1 subunit|uniref:cytochrome c1 n=1 Tax=uncultured Amphritea sp. TaxID=981605 RepID=UPI00260BB995|nr:cytochrome c1 [uncultured Amphritea sp.]
MKKFFIAILLVLAPVAASAATGGVHLDEMAPDHANKESLQRGMATFVNHCMGCHSANFQRYERAAMDLDMPNELVQKHLIFGDSKVGEQMTIAMPQTDGAAWFGTPPPDLTLETRLRGEAWVYTYLRSFYKDPARPWGVNNVVFPDVGMPNVLEGLQGLQVNHCTPAEMAHQVKTIDPLTGVQMGGCLSIAEKGQLSVEEFDNTIYDLVNFMSYMGNPVKLQSQAIGYKVLIFLFIFFFFAYALKKEYWKDVH